MRLCTSLPPTCGSGPTAGPDKLPVTPQFWPDLIAGKYGVVQVRQPGEYVFVPKAHWHTANPLQPTTMLFITAGEGTQVRPRD